MGKRSPTQSLEKLERSPPSKLRSSREAQPLSEGDAAVDIGGEEEDIGVVTAQSEKKSKAYTAGRGDSYAQQIEGPIEQVQPIQDQQQLLDPIQDDVVEQGTPEYQEGKLPSAASSQQEVEAPKPPRRLVSHFVDPLTAL